MEFHAIEIVGPIATAVRTVAASATVNPNDHLIVVNNGAAAVTITLPSAPLNPGRVIVIHRDIGSAGAITVNAVAGLVQAQAGTGGATTTIPTTAGQRAAHFHSNGTNWLRIPAA